MDKAYEDKYLELEPNNFWFESRRELVVNFLKKIIKPEFKILEIGSGSGANIKRIKQSFPKITIKGIEYSQKLVDAAKKKKLNVQKGDATKLKEKSESYDLVICLDVLEHIKNDEKAISEIRRVLKKDGFALISVPAFNVLWGDQDIVNHHYRRYSKKILLTRFQKFKRVKTTYWNFFMFFPIFISRLFQRKNRKSQAKTDFERTKKIDWLFKKILMFENALIKLGIYLPFGVSFFAIVKK